VDFLTKPVEESCLLRAVRAALQRAAEQRDFVAETAMFRQRYASLTPRERDVMEHVVAGQLNKQIAGDLGTGEHTIKVHRARVMEKMGVESLADLVRAAAMLGVGGK
jgi:FixJ family two-component response regulator